MVTKIKFRGVPLKAVTFIANYHSNRAGFIIIREKRLVVDTILKYLNKICSSIDFLCLDFILKESDSEKNLLISLQENKVSFLQKNGSASPYIFIDKDWEQFLRGRSQKFRYNLKTCKRKFESETNFEVVKYSETGIQKAMAELFSVSRKTWKFDAGTAIVSSKENIMFYSSLAEISAQKGWLNIWILRVDNNPIAFTFNIKFKNKCFVLKNGFDNDYSKFAPSKFISSIAIKDSFDNNLTEYEWLGDSESFKMEWTTLCKEHYKYWIFSDSLIGKTLFFAEKNIIPFIKN
jgi:CelD/BcsL family acetyltransferase involved in cellulose biosynthesis